MPPAYLFADIRYFFWLVFFCCRKNQEGVCKRGGGGSRGALEGRGKAGILFFRYTQELPATREALRRRSHSRQASGLRVEATPQNTRPAGPVEQREGGGERYLAGETATHTPELRKRSGRDRGRARRANNIRGGNIVCLIGQGVRERESRGGCGERERRGGGEGERARERARRGCKG